MTVSVDTGAVAVTAPSVEGAYVGTSGWSYPSWKPGFYPSGTDSREFLRHYAQRFTTVELNTTGYRVPAESQFERWAEQTPGGFRFAVKAPGHRPRLVAELAERLPRLGDRLGPVRISLTSARDDGLVELLLGSLDPSLRLAFDLPHPSWDGIEGRLDEAGAVRVGSLDAAAGFRYVRFREPPYDDAALTAWAERLRPLLARGVEVFAYFRHEDEPTAPAYATRLLELLAAGARTS